MIAGLRDRGEMTILLTTHYLDEAERLCDRVAIMHAGAIVALDTPAALRSRLGARDRRAPRRRRRRRRARRRCARTASPATDAFAVGSTLTMPLHDRPRGDAIAAVDGSAWSPRARDHDARPTLDDVYLRLTGGRLADAA